MSTMTPADFFTLPSDPEEEFDETPAPAPSYDVEPFEPGASSALESIAVSLQAIAGTSPAPRPTSRLANAVREVLDGPAETPAEDGPSQAPAEVPAGVPAHVQPLVQDPPPHEAGVDAWRLHAKLLGHTGPEVDAMNKSQIRSLLGIPHPGE